MPRITKDTPGGAAGGRPNGLGVAVGESHGPDGRGCEGRPTPDAVTAAAREFAASVFAAPESKGGVMVRRWMLRATDDASERLVLARLAYWFGPRKEVDRPRATLRFGGHYWVAKSAAQLAEELLMSERTARRALRRLVAKGLLATTRRWYGGSPTNHYRISVEAVERVTACDPGAE
jgi:DNA-binding transcriptional ArsR family regulator